MLFTVLKVGFIFMAGFGAGIAIGVISTTETYYTLTSRLFEKDCTTSTVYHAAREHEFITSLVLILLSLIGLILTTYLK
jgi:hypothetical protein